MDLPDKIYSIYTKWPIKQGVIFFLKQWWKSYTHSTHYCLAQHYRYLWQTVLSILNGTKSSFFFLNFWVYLFIYLFIYLFMAVLGLRFCVRAFSSCGERGPLFIAVRGPLTIAASLVVEHRLQTRRLSNCGSRA